MIDRLKNRFYQSGQALLNILEYKIINLKLINNDYIHFSITITKQINLTITLNLIYF